LVKHFKSAAHISAEKRLLNFSQKKTNVDLMIDARRREADQKREQLLKLNEKIIITLIDVARFLGRQSLSFQGDENSEGMMIEKLREHMFQEKIVLFYETLLRLLISFVVVIQYLISGSKTQVYDHIM